MSRLTDIKIKKEAPPLEGSKPLKLRDEDGLMLEISAAGTRTWRLRIRTGGKDSTVTLGHYPKMSLSAARDARDAAKAAGGKITPAPEEITPEPEEITPSFRAAAMEWHERNSPRWRERHAKAVLATLEKEVFPVFGDKPITEIKAPEIMRLLKAIEGRGVHDHAHDMRQRIAGVFQYAEAAGYRDGNPAEAMRHVLKPLPTSKPRAAVTTIAEARECLAAGERVPAFPVTRLALRFLALTAQRPGEVRFAEWTEFEGLDGDNPTWRIPAEHMKMKKEHFVPLAPQAVELLAELQKLSGRGALAFPASDDTMQPMSENAIGYLLNRAGYAGRQVPHGWRATFSTIMNGLRPGDRAVIDLMLAHEPKDRVESAYNRQMHWQTRRSIADEWATLLLAERPGAADIIDLPRRSSPASMAATA